MTIAMRSAMVVVLLAFAHAGWAQTADEVIEKSLSAMGGRAAFAKIKSRAMSGTITLQTPAGDVTGSIEVLNALPNKSRTVIKADLSALGVGQLEVDQRFDGETGYVTDTLQGNREISGHQLDNMRNTGFPHLFLHYKDMGFNVKLQGKETLGDGEAYVLLFEPAKGPAIREYIDTKTMLPLQFVLTANVPQVGVDVEQTTTLTDYREVDGVKVPFKLTASSSLQSFTVTLNKIEHNVAIDDKLFARP